MKHALYSVTFTSIAAAAGLITGNAPAWKFALATAALCIVTEELRNIADQAYPAKVFPAVLASVAAALSWVTGFAALFSLL